MSLGRGLAGILAMFVRSGRVALGFVMLSFAMQVFGLAMVVCRGGMMGCGAAVMFA
ncbi:MAG: hypothetical protein KGI75_24895 [Rhizobiaceae bacterium]|nr:hypothetical protein [Rhizobiaceae bacterium]